MNNDGSASSPWSTLDSVFITHKKINSGDTIFLKSGYHGNPIIYGNVGAAHFITIIALPGQQSVIKKLLVKDASRWKVSGLKVSPEAIGSYEKGDFIAIKASSNDIIIENCTITSTDSCINSWTSEKLLSRFGLGIRVEGKNCTLSSNIIKQVLYGVSVSKGANGTLVANNVIYGFINDGIRGLADDCIFEFNTVAGSYGIDENHDDAFQSWSTDEKGTVGKGKVSNVILRGNLFVSQVDPKQPFIQERGMQGIGNFDGFFENWIVENNVIITDMWHGIAFYGARNCRISNNVVLKTAFNVQPFTPWIAIYDHKKLGESQCNIICNNITSTIKEKKGVTSLTNNINIQLSDYGSYFINWKKYNVKLKDKKYTAGIAYFKARLIDLKKFGCR